MNGIMTAPAHGRNRARVVSFAADARGRLPRGGGRLGGPSHDDKRAKPNRAGKRIIALVNRQSAADKHATMLESANEAEIAERQEHSDTARRSWTLTKDESRMT